MSQYSIEIVRFPCLGICSAFMPATSIRRTVCFFKSLHRSYRVKGHPMYFTTPEQTLWTWHWFAIGRNLILEAGDYFTHVQGLPLFYVHGVHHFCVQDLHEVCAQGLLYFCVQGLLWFRDKSYPLNPILQSNMMLEYFSYYSKCCDRKVGWE